MVHKMDTAPFCHRLWRSGDAGAEQGVSLWPGDQTRRRGGSSFLLSWRSCSCWRCHSSNCLNLASRSARISRSCCSRCMRCSASFCENHGVRLSVETNLVAKNAKLKVLTLFKLSTVTRRLFSVASDSSVIYLNDDPANPRQSTQTQRRDHMERYSRCQSPAARRPSRGPSRSPPA